MSINYASVLREELAQAITNQELENVSAVLNYINYLSPAEKLDIFTSPANSHDFILHIAADCEDVNILRAILITIASQLNPNEALVLFEETNKIGQTAIQIAKSANHRDAAELIDQCFIETEQEILKQLEILRNSPADLQATIGKSWVEKVSKRPSTPDIQCMIQ